MLAKEMKIRYLGEEDRFSRLLHAIKEDTPVYSSEWYKRFMPTKVPLTNISLEGTPVLEYLETIALLSLDTAHTLDQPTKVLLDVNFDKIDLLHAAFIMSQKAKTEEAERYDNIMSKLFEKGAVPSADILTHIDANGKFKFLEMFLAELPGDNKIKDFGAKAIVGLLLSDKINDDTKLETIKGIVEKGLEVSAIKPLQDRDHKIFYRIMDLYGNTEANDPVWTAPLRAVMCSVQKWEIKDFETRFTELKERIEIKTAAENIMNTSAKLVSRIKEHLSLEERTKIDLRTLDAARDNLNGLGYTPPNIDMLAQSFIQGRNEEHSRATREFETRKRTFEGRAETLNNNVAKLYEDFSNPFSADKERYERVIAKHPNIQPEPTSWYITTLSGVKLDLSKQDSTNELANIAWLSIDNQSKLTMLKEFIANTNIRAIDSTIKLGIDFSQSRGTVFELFAGQSKGKTALYNPQLALALYVLDVPTGVEISTESLSPVLQRSIQCLNGKLETIPMSI